MVLTGHDAGDGDTQAGDTENPTDENTTADLEAVR